MPVVFDLSLYFPTPLLTTEGYVALCNTLIADAPPNPPPHILVGIHGLEFALAEANTALTLRLDEDLGPELEREFDALIDWVWLEVRHRLEFHDIYTCAGFAKFTDEDRVELDYELRLAATRIARRILKRLFSEGNEFLRAPFAQQAVHMAARLRWLEQKGLPQTLAKLVGEDLVKLLECGQRRYQIMVNCRSARDGKSIADRRELRDSLRRHIGGYCGLIGGMVDYTNESSVAVVEHALRAVLIARIQAKRKTWAALVEAEEDAGEGAEAEEIEDATAGETEPEDGEPSDG